MGAGGAGMGAGGAGETVAHRLLGCEHARDDEHHGDEVHRSERLAEQDDPEQHPDDGVDEADDRGRGRAEDREAPEPQHVGEAAADEAEVGERTDGREVDRRRCALDDERDRHEHDATGDELPGRRGDHVDRRRPLLREHEAARREQDGEQAGPQAECVERPVEAVLEHEQTDTEEADHTGGQGDPARPVAEQDPRDGHRHHRRGGDEGRSEPARQAVGREEEQGIEDTDVEAAEHERAPPPVTSRQAPQPQEHEQTHGQGAERGGEERTVGGQPELRHGIRRSPHGGREGGQGDGAPATSVIFHGSQFTFLGR